MTDLSTATRHLARLVAHPSVSSDSNRAIIDDLATTLEEAGARVEVMTDATGTKANLWATLGPEGDGGLILSGHTDVVPVADQDWTSDPFEMVARDGRLHGRGTCDMKGFIACCLAMLPAFAEARPARPLHFAFTHDEEVGCLGAQALVAELARRGLRPGMALIGEPTEMAVIDGHKGCCEYSVHVTGRDGHGSAPDLGVNAVAAAVRYAGRLLELAEELKGRAPEGSPFDPPWTTANLGGLNGGVARNVIPGKARIDWEMRPVQDGDAEFVKVALEACIAKLLPGMRAVHPGADIRTEVIGEVAGLAPTRDNPMRDLIQALTGASGPAQTVPFSTEAGLFQSLGAAAVVCGPGSIAQAHKPDEFVSLDQMSRCLDLLRDLAGRL